MAAMSNVGSGGRWRGVSPLAVGVVVMLLAGLYLVDRSLAAMEQHELRQEAVRFAAEGAQLLAAKRADEASKKLQQAHALFRQDRGYSLSYADALLQAGRTDEGQTVLQELLNQNPNDGRANLLMARAMVREEQATEAASYYHRAIYGTWDEDAAAKAVQARLEFTDWLAKSQSTDALLAELLPLEASAGNDVKIQARVAKLFLEGGAPERAAAEYKKIIAAHPEEASAFAGLGEAEMQLGHDSAAERAFQKAGANARQDVVRAVIALDPTPRRLSSAEKYERSLRLLEMTETALKACPAAMGHGQADKRLAEAEAARQQKMKGIATNERSETMLDLAAGLWQLTTKECSSEETREETLSVVMKRIGRP